jgi:hypothetical protein
LPNKKKHPPAQGGIGAGGACLCDGRTRRTTAKDRYAVSVHLGRNTPIINGSLGAIGQEGLVHFACGEINGRAFGGDLRWLSRTSCPPSKKSTATAVLFCL